MYTTIITLAEVLSIRHRPGLAALARGLTFLSSYALTCSCKELLCFNTNNNKNDNNNINSDNTNEQNHLFPVVICPCVLVHF